MANDLADRRGAKPPSTPIAADFAGTDNGLGEQDIARYGRSAMVVMQNNSSCRHHERALLFAQVDRQSPRYGGNR